MTPFSSFWQAGYEGADHINPAGVPLSMNDLNQHQARAAEDYAALAPFSLRTVRESVGWRLCERDGHYDFSSVAARMQAAEQQGIQLSWTICHYGWPAGLSLFDHDFVSRFAAFCGALARFLAPLYRQPPVYSPMNEISFVSWGISVGLFACDAVPGPDPADAAKQQLVRATLAACDAIWLADPRARLLHCDPLIHIVPDPDDPTGAEAARAMCDTQYQAWDMLSGRRNPELGGAARYLDLVGVNYYHDNQWEHGSGQRLDWHLGDDRRQPLHRMLQQLWQRYQRPLLLAETSHVGSGRGAWIHEIATQVAQAQLAGVELLGICLYPILDRPLWEETTFWTRSGLWDLDRLGPDPYARQLQQPYAQALRQSQRFLQHIHTQRHQRQEHTMKPPVLLVFSHLRWGFVFQRPQQLLTRLAQHYRVLFVEEPVWQAGPPGLHKSSPAANITVIQPHTDSDAPGFHDSQLAPLLLLLTPLLEEDEQPLIWFYTPMALPLLTPFNPALVIYDCMDELSAFWNAPRQLQQRESALMTRADLVFTGGTSLYEARRDKHPQVYCFPSSVDAVHFEQARDRSNHHPLQDAIPPRRLGYYGVLDERIDLPLIAALADRHPDWQIVMVGPVVKIDPASLPQRANIHWMGQQPYQALPQFLAGWDVCLMPFAINASTRYISPTKVLEYMAAQLPIVSTAIVDVARHYAEEVAVAETHADFITACEEAMTMSSADRLALAGRMQEKVDATSWDRTAEQIHTLIQQTLTQRQPATETPDRLSAQANVTPLVPVVTDPQEEVPCLVIRAGPAG